MLLRAVFQHEKGVTSGTADLLERAVTHFVRSHREEWRRRLNNPQSSEGDVSCLPQLV